MIKQFSDAELFEMFNIDLGCFVEATNKHVNADQQIDPSELYGKDMWEVRYARKSKVNKDALSAEELERERKRERGERVARLREIVSQMSDEQMEADDVSICDLIEKPVYA